MVKVIALFKKGSCLNVNNYCTITVSPTLGMMLNRAVHIQTYDFLITNKQLTSSKFSFCKKLSNAVALARFANTIFKSMDDGQLTGVAFLNLSKALDMVNHNHLLLKLKSIGFSSHVCSRFNLILHIDAKSPLFITGSLLLSL